MSNTPLPEFRADRGTAARSGAGDLALFAAVPIAFAGTPANAGFDHLTIRPAGGDAGASSSSGSSPDAVHDVGGSNPRLSASAPVHHSSESAARDDHVVSLHDASAADSHPVLHGSGIATYVPAPHHEFVPPASAVQAIAPSEAAVSHGGGVSAATVAPATADVAHALDTILASAQTLTGALAALNDHLLPQLGTVDQQVTDTIDQAQAIVDATLGHVGDLGAALGTTIAGAGATVDHVVATAGSTIDTALGQTTEVAGNTLSHVTDTVGDLTHAVGGTVSGLSDTLLHDDAVGGSDPAGGITTLVGMVSAADMFHIHDDGPGASDMGLAPALGVGGAADMLADVVPSDILLGVTDHHGGLGGALHDDHGHLLGLG